jgi:hypothetical protein
MQEEDKYVTHVRKYILEDVVTTYTRRMRVQAPKPQGEARLRLFVHLVHSGMGVKLAGFQVEFFKRILCTVVQNLVGPDWANIGHRIMKEFKWKACPKIAVASSPRRMGKTFLVAVVQCSLALCGVRLQSTFSTSKRTSAATRNYCQQLMLESGYSSRMLTRGTNVEQLRIKPLVPSALDSLLNFYPANEKISFFSLVFFVFCFFLSFCFLVTRASPPGVPKKVRFFFVGSYF